MNGTTLFRVNHDSLVFTFREDTDRQTDGHSQKDKQKSQTDIDRHAESNRDRPVEKIKSKICWFFFSTRYSDPILNLYLFCLSQSTTTSSCFSHFFKYQK